MVEFSTQLRVALEGSHVYGALHSHACQNSILHLDKEAGAWQAGVYLRFFDEVADCLRVFAVMVGSLRASERTRRATWAGVYADLHGRGLQPHLRVPRFDKHQTTPHSQPAQKRARLPSCIRWRAFCRNFRLGLGEFALTVSCNSFGG